MFRLNCDCVLLISLYRERFYVIRSAKLDLIVISGIPLNRYTRGSTVPGSHMDKLLIQRVINETETNPVSPAA